MRQLFVSFFVFFLLLFGTHFVYQNWLENDSNLQLSDSVAYSHASKIIELSAPSGKRLVPVGAVLGVNDVDHVEYTFEVAVEEGCTIDVLLTNVIIQNEMDTFQQVDDMLVYEYDVEMINSLRAVVTITVSLRMPTSVEERSMLQGSKVSFQILFNQESVE